MDASAFGGLKKLKIAAGLEILVLSSCQALRRKGTFARLQTAHLAKFAFVVKCTAVRAFSDGPACLALQASKI